MAWNSKISERNVLSTFIKMLYRRRLRAELASEYHISHPESARCMGTEVCQSLKIGTWLLVAWVSSLRTKPTGHNLKSLLVLQISGTPEEKSAKFAEYFKRRSLQQDNSLAMSPEQFQPSNPGTL